MREGAWVNDAKWFGTRLAYAEELYTHIGVSALLCKDTSGKPLSVNTAFSAHITDKQSAANVPYEYRGLLTVAGAGVHEVSWIDISFDIPNFVAAAKYVHRLTPEQREAINPLMTVDPGDVQEPYVWNHDGTNYLLVRLAVPRTAS